jgi:hypothetical protein
MSIAIYYATWDTYFKGTVTWNAFRTAATRAKVPCKWVPNKKGSYNVHKEYTLEAVVKAMQYMIDRTNPLNNQKMFLPKWNSVITRAKELLDEVPTSSDS